MTWDELRRQILDDHLPHPRHAIDERRAAESQGGWELNDRASGESGSPKRSKHPSLAERLGLGKVITAALALEAPTGTAR